ncbi:MAG TPA: FliM/FliN family flagellar motor switch protein [Candidatus Eisenbacteria bacterium]|jgi:hypothetical protein|nr:FliM/FliN family flagellar motor switch protein [Candidatus Eisenbacteria bacterium]
MSRLLTPAEIAALRAVEPFVPAPTETFHVTIEAGTAALTPDAVASLEPGSVIPIRAARAGLVEIVANAVVVGYGRLESRDGDLSVRVVSLPRVQSGGVRPARDAGGRL